MTPLYVDEYPSGRNVHAAADGVPPTVLFIVIQLFVGLLNPSLIKMDGRLVGKAVAVSVTFDPEHIAPDGSAVILTLAGKSGFTVIITVFDVAGLFVVQTGTLEATIHETASLFTGVYVNVELFVPELTPLTSH